MAALVFSLPCSLAPLLPVSPPLADEVGCGFGPGGKFEWKTGVEETAGNNVAAFENQFRLRAQEEHCNFEERGGRGQAVGHVPGFAQRGHELAIGQWMGRTEIDGAVDFFI